ncbi:MAG: HAD family hydrolase [Phycisphaerales bacterium JB037]
MHSHTGAVIFDVDGVLVDSYEAHFQSWLTLAEEAGFSFTREQFAATFGRTSRDIIQHFWGEVAEARVGPMDDRKEALFRDIVRGDFPAMPGADALIAALHDAGLQLAVGSSGPPENVALVLESLEYGSLIDARVTGMDVSQGKPDPEVFQIAAKRLGCEVGECVVVEDAPAGIEAAHRAGMAAIGLCSTGRTRDELRDADLVVEELCEITPAAVRELIALRAESAG